ncbi:MAG TPA: nucleotidyl transferase AbiEii/AbiGii toxin family protein [Polyangiaceae bacterium]|jgi:hypothetical protein|nr:nucleotidyl transferase AbiEii/AbiGii toxin family protein [Polyangiaceae bacterium]
MRPRLERGFFLTGGAALVGFYLHHRTTDDLDLFTTSEEAFERGRHVMPAVATALGGTLEVRQDAPGFRRYAISRAGETLVVDTVPATLAWLIAGLEIDESWRMPNDVTVADLRVYKEDLVKRLRRLALPGA